jgi:hypothetical protein
MQAIKGKATFESLDPADLLDAVKSIKGQGGQNIMVEPPGQVDQQISWALSDLKQSRNATDAVERDRCATNAIMSARRALAALVDWYLKRDCFSLCMNAPRQEKDKADILLKRGLFDEVTSSVLYRAIQKRNEVEHKYQTPTVEAAEDVFELMRRTIQCLSVESNPSEGPCLFGAFSNSIGFGPTGANAQFYGWLDEQPCFLLYSIDANPWLGVILPEAPEKALVRRAYFNEITTDLLLEVLRALENTFGRPRGYISPVYWKLLFSECGFVPGEPSRVGA